MAFPFLKKCCRYARISISDDSASILFLVLAFLFSKAALSLLRLTVHEVPCSHPRWRHSQTHRGERGEMIPDLALPELLLDSQEPCPLRSSFSTPCSQRAWVPTVCHSLPQVGGRAPLLYQHNSYRRNWLSALRFCLFQIWFFCFRLYIINVPFLLTYNFIKPSHYLSLFGSTF